MSVENSLHYGYQSWFFTMAAGTAYFLRNYISQHPTNINPSHLDKIITTKITPIALIAAGSGCAMSYLVEKIFNQVEVDRSILAWVPNDLVKREDLAKAVTTIALTTLIAPEFSHSSCPTSAFEAMDYASCGQAMILAPLVAKSIITIGSRIINRALFD